MGVFINSDAWNFWLSEPIEKYDRAELEAAIRRDVDYYAVPGVEAVFYNMNFQRSFYDTKVGTPYWKDCSIGPDGKLLLRGKPIPSREDEESPEPTYRTMFLRSKNMFEKFPDFMAYRYRYCHEKGIEMWHSMRMDDIHHATLGQEWRPQHGDLWLDHKEYVRGWYRHTWRGDWHDNALDYGEKAVYDYHLAMAREYLLDYESDGLELDWLRSVPVFKPGFDEANTGLMTQFMREVRAAAVEAEAKWGHRVRIAARVPGYVKDAVGNGMDVHAWAAEGLVDVIVPSCNNTGTEGDYDIGLWRVIAPKPVVIAPNIDYNMTSNTRWVLDFKPETDAGFASSFYQQGADTIYFYNHFATLSVRKPFAREFFTVAADRHAVAVRPRRHVVTRHDPNGEGRFPQPCYPLEIWPGCCNGGVKVNAGEETAGRRARIVIGATVPLDIDVLLNTGRCPLLPPEAELPEVPRRKDEESFYVQAEVPAGLLHDGWNAVEIFNKDASHTIKAHELIWMEIVIDKAGERQ